MTPTDPGREELIARLSADARGIMEVVLDVAARRLTLVMAEIHDKQIAPLHDIETAARELDKLFLVIESAVRNADLNNHKIVLAALKANSAALRARSP